VGIVQFSLVLLGTSEFSFYSRNALGPRRMSY
jgi:hypothetical protein